MDLQDFKMEQETPDTINESLHFGKKTIVEGQNEPTHKTVY